MPNFDVTLISGATPENWSDTRTNPRGVAQHLYWKVAAPASLAAGLATVVLRCVVGGVTGPLDGALGGNLFAVSRVAWSGSFPFAIGQTAGKSSEVTLRFAFNMLGHQEIAIRRPGGGAIVLSFEVE